MEYVAAFDLGTTAIKGILLSRDGEIQAECSIVIETYYRSNNIVEQNPEEWWEAVKKIVRKWFVDKKINPESIKAITFSGQMEDVILIDEQSETTNAVLYADTRAYKEADIIKEAFPDFKKITGNNVTSSSPIAKMLWLKANKKLKDNSRYNIVFSAKDYIIFKLTGSIVTDSVTGATTGIMDLKRRKWELGVLEKLEIEEFILPRLLNPQEEAGKLSEEGAKQSGFLPNTPVLCGAGDAGASTLGAGATNVGDCYMYLGTTGWVAISSESTYFQEQGLFTLAHVVPELTITIAPLLNIGNVHAWAMKTFLGNEDYDEFEESIQSSPIGANGLIFLPYLNGERGPIQDINAKGSYWGITHKTQKNDFTRAALEGVSYSLFQVTKILMKENSLSSITLIGGGAKSKVWCQLLADISNVTVKVPNNSEYLPSIGIGATAFQYLGWIEDYKLFIQQKIENSSSKIYYPIKKNHEIYSNIFKQYLKLYPAMKRIYE
ncbi:xylulokinase [Metaplanococcus flavidus]|uniref:FGGY-family carbohydrate kinase n=1 Tax=Metaplanococcus flavidus TaxID=569883 RepID=A0ABW3L6I8_9BACL